MVTGSSVIGLKYKGGVLLAADTLASYGSTKRYKDVRRCVAVTPRVLVAAGGEVSDLQYLERLFAQLSAEDLERDEGNGSGLSAAEAFSWLSRVMHNRRNKMDPLWLTCLVAGPCPRTGEPFLGQVAANGTHFPADHCPTGFAAHLARPLLREEWRPDLSRDEAEALLRRCLAVCYYRDKQSMNKFCVADVGAGKDATVGVPFALDVSWGLRGFENPTRLAPGAW